MKLLSKIYDDFLKADNLLFESSIEEYLYVAREIINNTLTINDYYLEITSTIPYYQLFYSFIFYHYFIINIRFSFHFL